MWNDFYELQVFVTLSCKEPYMPQNIPVVENILNANDRIAQENYNRLENAGVFSINILASPGAGKTSLIEQTLPRLKDRLRVAAIQINTGGDCHLDAVMLHGALEKLDLTQFDLLIVENVGNLVCPANFKLGTHKTVLVASVPEGDDKPYKYPGTYRGVDVLIINKIDLLPYVKFNMDYFERGVQVLNPNVKTFRTSCTTGEGLDAWTDWLVENAQR